jgi:hypothetical protein
MAANCSVITQGQSVIFMKVTLNWQAGLARQDGTPVDRQQ